MDVTKSEDIIAAADYAVQQFGGIDIWINNAGIPSFTPLLDLTEEDWDRVMAVNLRGLFVGAREGGPPHDRSQQGRRDYKFVLVGRLSWHQRWPSRLRNFQARLVRGGATRQMALELAPHGIRVLAVAPGYCQTEHTAHLADLEPEMLAKIPIPGIAGSKLGRVGVADDIARVVLFCVSDLALFMSGQTLLADGGENA